MKKYSFLFSAIIILSPMSGSLASSIDDNFADGLSQIVFACHSHSKRTSVIVSLENEKYYLSIAQQVEVGDESVLINYLVSDLEVNLLNQEIWPSPTTLRTVAAIPGFRKNAEMMYVLEDKHGIKGYVRYLKDGVAYKTDITCRTPK